MRKGDNYISLINSFWRFYDENRNKLNVSDIVLYKVILRYCNKIGWINPFFIDPFLMSQINPLSINTYYKSLDRLHGFGLINYEKGKHNVSKSNITILKITNSTKTSINNSIDNSVKFSVVNNNKTIIQEDNKTIILLNNEILKKEKTIEEQALLISELEKKLSKPKKKKEPLHFECKNYFLEYYKENKSADFYWSVKESVALNSILKKIRTLEVGEMESKTVIAGFQKLIISVKDFDPWIFENFSLTLINSKFNELIEKIRTNKKLNGANKSNNKEACTMQELKQVLSKHFD